jgi:hypothetical protein
VIVYVETNFVLELALLQQEHEECETLLDLAKEHSYMELALPAFSIGEAYEAWGRKLRQRNKLQDDLKREIDNSLDQSPTKSRRRALES